MPYTAGLPYYGLTGTAVKALDFNDNGTFGCDWNVSKALYKISGNLILEAVADKGYVFDEWDVEEYDESVNAAVPIERIKTITPIFEEIQEPPVPPIDPSKPGSNVTGSVAAGDFNFGIVAALLAIAALSTAVLIYQRKNQK